jgi:hypothetical protein
VQNRPALKCKEKATMARIVILAVLGMLLLSFGPVQSSPVKGHYREAQLRDEDKSYMVLGNTYEFQDTFRANQRACVIVEGDHKPVVNLSIKILDVSGKVVAEDTAGGDLIAVMWYPPKTQPYRIVISSDGTKEDNRLDIVVK